MCMKNIYKSPRKWKIFVLLREKENLLFLLLFAFIVSNSLSIKFHIFNEFFSFLGLVCFGN